MARNFQDDSYRGLDKGAAHSGIRFPVKNFSSSQRRRVKSPHFRFKATKPISTSKKVFSDKPSQSSRIFAKSRLHGEVGLITSLLPYSYKASPPTFFGSLNPKRSFLHDMSTIRPLNRSAGFCEDFQLASKSIETQKYKNNCILGRLPPSEPKSRGAGKSRLYSNKIPNRSWMENKLQEISFRPNSKVRIPGRRLGHTSVSKICSSKQNRFDQEGPSKANSVRRLELAKSEISSWKLKLRCICDSFGPATLSLDSDYQQDPTGKCSKEDVSYSLEGSARSEMVERQPESKIRDFSRNNGRLFNHRRFRDRLGCSSSRQEDRWNLDKKAKILAHKPKRAVCSLQGHKTVQTQTKKQNGPSPVRQSNSNCLHKESGRHQIPKSLTNDGENSLISAPIPNSASNTPHSGNIQLCSGPSVSTQTTAGLAFEKDTHSEDFCQMGPSNYRPVCNQKIKSCSQLRQSISKRFDSDVHRCVQSGMGLRTCMGVSSSGINSESLAAPQECQRNLYHNCSEMAPGVLVARSTEAGSGETNTTSQSSSAPNRHSQQSTSSSNRKVIFGGLENSGWSQYLNGWHPSDIDLLQRAWRPGTLKTYSTAWRRWTEWANQKSISINSPTAEEVALFLSHLHQRKGLSYSTVLVNKSVIACFANPTRSDALSGHPIVQHMLKAINMSKAKENKSLIWDVNNLINWLKLNLPNEQSLFQVSRHLALLLVLASGRRIHDLTLLSINPDHFQDFDSWVVLWPKFGSKTDSATHRQSGWKIMRNIKDQSLDIVHWLRIFIDLSRQRRSAVPNLDSLFISCRGMVRPATRAVIAGWIKTALKEIGVETSPGSIRSAVGSSRFNSGMALDEILKKGNWQNSNNFFKFYCKDINRGTPIIHQDESPSSCFTAI